MPANPAASPVALNIGQTLGATGATGDTDMKFIGDTIGAFSLFALLIGANYFGYGMGW